MSNMFPTIGHGRGCGMLELMMIVDEIDESEGEEVADR